MGYSQTVSVFVYKHMDTNNANNVTSTAVTWGLDQSLSSFLSALSSAGLTATFNSDTRKVTISGDAMTYLGSSIEPLNISSAYSSWGANGLTSKSSADPLRTSVSNYTDKDIVKFFLTLIC